MRSKSLMLSYVIYFISATALMAFTALKVAIGYGVNVLLLCRALNFEHKLHYLGHNQEADVPIGHHNSELNEFLNILNSPIPVNLSKMKLFYWYSAWTIMIVKSNSRQKWWGNCSIEVNKQLDLPDPVSYSKSLQLLWDYDFITF